MSLVESEHLGTPRSSSHICFWFGLSGIASTARGSGGFAEMQASIREDFSGTEMWRD